MPIFDHDGTAVYQIGTVYDHDGTAVHQIGKVYDHDGTAVHLLYSAEEWLFKDGTLEGAYSNIVTNVGCTSSCDFRVNEYSNVPYKTFNIYTTANAYQAGENLYGKNERIDLTGYNTIKLKWSHSNGTANSREIHLAVTDNITNDGTDYRYFNLKNAALKWAAVNQSSNGGGEVVLDVSDITGEHYIVFGTGTYYNTWLNVYFTELHLS